eukprot:scaffold79684_cov66-Phaeocystis_antarctica.AAC.2
MASDAAAVAAVGVRAGGTQRWRAGSHSSRGVAPPLACAAGRKRTGSAACLLAPPANPSQRRRSLCIRDTPPARAAAKTSGTCWRLSADATFGCGPRLRHRTRPCRCRNARIVAAVAGADPGWSAKYAPCSAPPLASQLASHCVPRSAEEAPVASLHLPPRHALDWRDSVARQPRPKRPCRGPLPGLITVAAAKAPAGLGLIGVERKGEVDRHRWPCAPGVDVQRQPPCECEQPCRDAEVRVGEGRVLEEEGEVGEARVVPHDVVHARVLGAAHIGEAER